MRLCKYKEGENSLQLSLLSLSQNHSYSMLQQYGSTFRTQILLYSSLPHAIISIWEYFPESSPERASLVAQTVKKFPCDIRDLWSLGPEDPLEKGMETHSNILAWRIPWTGDPGGLWSMGLQRVGHYWMTNPLKTCHSSQPRAGSLASFPGCFTLLLSSCDRHSSLPVQYLLSLLSWWCSFELCSLS